MFELTSRNIVQTKLKIGQPNDKFEKEADQVADQVMRMSTTQIPPIQCKCAKCEEEEVQMKPLENTITPIVQKQEEEEEILQMKGYRDESSSVSNLESSLQQSKGGGYHMDASTQLQMNQGIGADFSNVKIHTDTNAIHMNQQLNAKAFTNGSDVYFNQGQYNPQSSEGKHLLAHELTHVVQQNNTIQGKMIQRMLACPSNYPQMPSTDWRPYPNSTSWFHCGFRTILENRAPTPSDPMNECVYDHSGVLVDANHPYAGCRGTPDQYDGHGGLSTPYDTLMHIVCDTGGIVHEGIPAFITSRRYDINTLIQGSSWIPSFLKPVLIGSVNTILGLVQVALETVVLLIQVAIRIICLLIELIVDAIRAGLVALQRIIRQLTSAIQSGLEALARLIISLF
ncbi:DUF4157 domain-containing protein [uncultured Aquimarina sp.]|uniref:eCIS core domain-containing protein n=1 Tax=uncultured Aquimarina sp. TaxID=575652 RepID=UPI0026285968|nr:DUF4157 domain-containing protein [uncultured Aquimarina sp.]